MTRSKRSDAGYALVTTLLIAAITTALVVGFVSQVQTEQRIAINDGEYSTAFYAAEAGLEKLNSDLSKLFQTSVSPSQAQFQAVLGNAYHPAIPGVSYPGYSLTGGQSTRVAVALAAADTTVNVDSTEGWPSKGFLMIDAEQINYAGKTATTFTGLTRATGGSVAAAHVVNAGVSRSKVITISEGANAGLIAQIIPFTLDITARGTTGAETRLTREVQVALIPVFQFGIFSDSDLSFFAGPDFNFGGRVHTNGHLFLAEGISKTLTLSQKVTVAGDMIRQQLANGVSTSSGFTGIVRVITNPGVYRNLSLSEGSVVAGPGSAANTSWPALSLTTYNGNIVSKVTGGKVLRLPFVGDGASPIDLIKRPATGEDPNGILGQSRLYNQASLRILLSDSTANLPGAIPLTSASPAGTFGGVPVAQADPDDPDFRKPLGAAPFEGDLTSADTDFLNLLGGVIRIDRQKTDGAWDNVTADIMSFGIATNQPNAILRFQKLRPSPLSPGISADPHDYYPINMYDAREAVFRDAAPGTNQLRKLGVMNLVEVDVSNLKKWLSGTVPFAAPATGSQTLNNNGYILYFSDRRGNRNDPGSETGELGFEDIINVSNSEGNPDGVLDAGEDLNGNGVLDRYGANLPVAPFTLSADFTAPMQGPSCWTPSNSPTPAINHCDLTASVDAASTSFQVANGGVFPDADFSAFYRLESEWLHCTHRSGNTLTCARGQLGTTAVAHDSSNAAVAFHLNESALKNRVYYFRHGLRLINGTSPNLPTPGFTVTSENPVYVLGDYNANGTAPNDRFNGLHSFAAVIADAVTFLSKGWISGGDERSFNFPYTPADRVVGASDVTWYRTAVASGKGISFSKGSVASDFYGTDGGTHNFLRFLENWAGRDANYLGSMVSLFYYRQTVGTFKFSNLPVVTTIYGAPTRKYTFDTDFLVPSRLPPGTPRFRDINNLSFRQTIRAD